MVPQIVDGEVIDVTIQDYGSECLCKRDWYAKEVTTGKYICKRCGKCMSDLEFSDSKTWCKPSMSMTVDYSVMIDGLPKETLNKSDVKCLPPIKYRLLK